jgi:hypothetical protein
MSFRPQIGQQYPQRPQRRRAFAFFGVQPCHVSGSRIGAAEHQETGNEGEKGQRYDDDERFSKVYSLQCNL